MHKIWRVILTVILIMSSFTSKAAERLIYHDIVTDTDGNILPWYSPDPGESYDHGLELLWDFWKNMKECLPGVKHYLLYRTWEPESMGIGGDQTAMMLESFSLLYAYTGDREIVDNMIYQADFQLDNGMSSPDCLWPDLPFPCNTELKPKKYIIKKTEIPELF